jgi:hypothetical protein
MKRVIVEYAKSTDILYVNWKYPDGYDYSDVISLKCKGDTRKAIEAKTDTPFI